MVRWEQVNSFIIITRWSCCHLNNNNSNNISRPHTRSTPRALFFALSLCFWDRFVLFVLRVVFYTNTSSSSCCFSEGGEWVALLVVQQARASIQIIVRILLGLFCFYLFFSLSCCHHQLSFHFSLLHLRSIIYVVFYFDYHYYYYWAFFLFRFVCSCCCCCCCSNTCQLFLTQLCKLFPVKLQLSTFVCVCSMRACSCLTH